MPETVLQVDQLRASYGGGDILQGVSLTINPGEVVAVIGRNGVGKTTLMKCIIGLLAPTAGSIYLQDRNITRLPAFRRAGLGIGYVPQGREIFPELTVEENLRMGEQVGHQRRNRYDLVYEYFPILKERRRQLGGTMSGGEQQMLAIGRALVGNPDLLLLDEPSVGIQPSLIQEIGAALTTLNETERLTMFLVEQNMSLIADLGQRGYAMDKGRIVSSLSGEELRKRDLLLQYLAI
jgi:branched-chain amino acid transport system ATP-binding protein